MTVPFIPASHHGSSPGKPDSLMCIHGSGRLTVTIGGGIGERDAALLRTIHNLRLHYIDLPDNTYEKPSPHIALNTFIY